MTHPLRTSAAVLLFAAAALHIPALILAPSAQSLQMITAIILWAVLGLGVLLGSRGAAWLAFLGLLFGVATTIYNALSVTGLLSTLFWAIFTIDVLALLALIGVLWRNRTA
ncbi:MAG: hypothetical protein AAGA78_09125 [Pseudomonadota bacterium]